LVDTRLFCTVDPVYQRDNTGRDNEEGGEVFQGAGIELRFMYRVPKKRA